jgi:hypothetical protein
MSAEKELSEEAARILEQFPGPVEIYPDRVLLVGSIVLISLTLVLIAFAPHPVSVLSVPFVLILLVALIRLLITGKPVLVLSRDGLSARSTLRRLRYLQWKEVESVRTKGIIVDVFARDGRVVGISGLVGINGEQLALLLDRWRERASAARIVDQKTGEDLEAKQKAEREQQQQQREAAGGAAE